MCNKITYTRLECVTNKIKDITKNVKFRKESNKLIYTRQKF